jgi:intein-encoded DNA endonuclease-like protein
MDEDGTIPKSGISCFNFTRIDSQNAVKWANANNSSNKWDQTQERPGTIMIYKKHGNSHSQKHSNYAIVRTFICFHDVAV